MKRNLKLTGSVTVVAAMAMGLTACGGSEGIGGGGGNGDAADAGGPSVEYGATKEEYVAAFEEVEPIELDFQMASSNPQGYVGLRDHEWAEAVEEWSGGKITMNVHPVGAIASPTEVPNALVDGRLDVANYFGTYEPQEMSSFVDLTKSLVQQPSSPLIGELLTQAVMLDVGMKTPEVMADYEERGMHVLHPGVPSGNTTVICADDKEGPSNWAGSQIRGNAQAHEVQAEALGGTLSTVELGEVYEALERGVLDCSLGATATAVNVGWFEVAPHLKMPQEASFAPGPGSMVVGSVWEQLPLVAQQLMWDKMRLYISGEHFNAVTSVAVAGEMTEKGGGGMSYLDEESEAAISAANEEILAEVEQSTNLDGAALNSAVAESIDKWTGIAAELGYEETGDVLHFADWYEGGMDFENREYLQPFADRLFEEVMLEYRPS